MGMKFLGSTQKLFPKLVNLSKVEADGILQVGVKSVDLQRNTKSEGSQLGLY